VGGSVVISKRLRALRKAKKLTQHDLQKRAGIIWSYISRIENGHIAPSVATLEKFARAFKVPLYQLFYGEEEPAPLPTKRDCGEGGKLAWGSRRKDAVMLAKFRECLGRVSKDDMKLLMHMAQKMARRS
jgi:transcriptional regulator with XRE-family HTH domain